MTEWTSQMALAKQIAEDTSCAQGGLFDRAMNIMKHLDSVFRERNQASDALATIARMAVANGEQLRAPKDELWTY